MDNRWNFQSDENETTMPKYDTEYGTLHKEITKNTDRQKRNGSIKNSVQKYKDKADTYKKKWENKRHVLINKM